MGLSLQEFRPQDLGLGVYGLGPRVSDVGLRIAEAKIRPSTNSLLRSSYFGDATGMF